MRRPARWQSEFVERVSSLADMSGLPPSFVRVFAWMVICDPPHQSVDDLKVTLGLSSGAISMATSTLVRLGLAERIVLPGQRRLYYRLHSNGWERMLRLRLDGATQMRVIAEEAIGSAPEGKAPDRLEQMRAVYGWFETVMADQLDGAPWLSANPLG